MPFVKNQIHLVFHFFFVDKLGGVELAISFVPGEVDLAEATHSYTLQHVVGLNSFKFLVLVDFEDALKTQVAPDPSLPGLQLVVSETVCIGGLKVRYFAGIVS